MGREILPAVVHHSSEIVRAKVLGFETMDEIVVSHFLAPCQLLRVITCLITSCITSDRAIEVPKRKQVFRFLIPVPDTEIVVFLLIVDELECLNEKDEISDILFV